MKQISLNITLQTQESSSDNKEFLLFFFQFEVFITILSMKNSFKWVQTSLVLVQWFLRYTPRIGKKIFCIWNLRHGNPRQWAKCHKLQAHLCGTTVCRFNKLLSLLNLWFNHTLWKTSLFSLWTFSWRFICQFKRKILILGRFRYTFLTTCTCRKYV